MNSIQGLLDISDYEGYWDYINFFIDDYWLDEKLEELYPGNMYKGLIPTLVDGMMIKAEKSVVWSRILPANGETKVCPILMCPDDLDFSCTLIVAEIENADDVIKWKRIGLDTTKSWEPEMVGSEVEWFDKISPMSFKSKDYLAMLSTFESQMDNKETN